MLLNNLIQRTPAASSTTSTASTGAAGHTSTGTSPGDVSLLEMRLLQLTYLDVMVMKKLILVWFILSLPSLPPSPIKLSKNRRRQLRTKYTHYGWLVRT